jgi:hypothetical protein
MALVLGRAVLAAVLVASMGTAVAEPVATVRRAPALCVATGCAIPPLVVAGDLPDAEPVRPPPAAPPAVLAIADAPAALVPRLVATAVLRVAPKTSPPARI